MFISIMSGVIGEVTRQAPATAGTASAARRSSRQARSGAPRPAKARAAAGASSIPALPGTYRVLADSFRRAVGFYS
ncbi:MAG: hypothetical protein R3286_03755 [Gammaproteobacteria bacterium]|nr:hypothetical protein [Gammaproteobacteria bacterium]